MMALTIVDLYDRVSGWLESSRRHKAESIDRYLEIIEEACQELVRLAPEVTDESRLLQEKIRALYADAGMVLGPKLEREDLGVVMNSLASARILYWIRVLAFDHSEDFGSLDELRGLIARRGGPKGRGFASLDIVERALMAMAPDVAQHYWDPDRDPARNLETLRSACLRDFGQLKALRARLRAR